LAAVTEPRFFCPGSPERREEPEGRPAAYLAFFEEFNAGRFFEAHEVLEGLWLQVRGAPEARFYQALIQLAAAFVHRHRGREIPAENLLRLAADKLRGYPGTYLGLDTTVLAAQIARWRRGSTPLATAPDPGHRPRIEPPGCFLDG
jgi:predicted metal-dependent hydrolase